MDQSNNQVYFKIVKKNLEFRNYGDYSGGKNKYEEKLNIFKESGDDNPAIRWRSGNEPDGFYFATKDTVHQFYDYGDTLAVIEIPDDPDLKIVDNSYTNMFIFKEFHPLSEIQTYDKFGIKNPELTTCAKKGYFGLVEYLFSLGVDQDGINRGLVSAVEGRDPVMVKYFLDNGADINFEMVIESESSFNSYLSFNCILGDYDILDVLCTTNALMHAVVEDDIAMVKFLVQNGADVNNVNGSALMLGSACECKYRKHCCCREICQFLVDNGADVNAYNGLVFQLWVRKKDIAMVKYLMENGANIHLDHDQAIINSVIVNRLDILKLLVDNGGNIRAGDDRPLMLAVDYYNKIDHKCLDMVKYLIANGANIHARNGHALKESVEKGNTDIVRLLIDNGADKNILNDELKDKIENLI